VFRRSSGGDYFEVTLRGGAYFTQAIAEALDSASCVIVLRSAESIRSRWVGAEAYHAWETDKPLSRGAMYGVEPRPVCRLGAAVPELGETV